MTLKTGDGSNTGQPRSHVGRQHSRECSHSVQHGKTIQTLNVDTGTQALTIGGTLQVTDAAGNNSATFGNAAAGGGTTGTNPLVVRGDVTLNGVPTITLNSSEPDQFLGNFTANVAPAPLPSRFCRTPTIPAPSRLVRISRLPAGPAGTSLNWRRRQSVGT